MLASGATKANDHQPQPDHPQRDNSPNRAAQRGSRRRRPLKARRAHSRWDHRVAPDLGLVANPGRPPPGAPPPASSKKQIITTRNPALPGAWLTARPRNAKQSRPEPHATSTREARMLHPAPSSNRLELGSRVRRHSPGGCAPLDPPCAYQSGGRPDDGWVGRPRERDEERRGNGCAAQTLRPTPILCCAGLRAAQYFLLAACARPQAP